MNRVKVLLFATLRQRAGAKSVELEVPDGTDVRGLKEHLASEYPSLKEAMSTVVVAINREYAPEEAIIPANGEVALFPPVSGG
jgi:molybdopterin converting factor subunit 1